MRQRRLQLIIDNLVSSTTALTQTDALFGYQSDYHVLAFGGSTFLVTMHGATQVMGIEQGSFSNTIAQSWSRLLAGTAAFNGLRYIAAYGDPRAAFGTDAAGGLQHYAEHGFARGAVAVVRRVGLYCLLRRPAPPSGPTRPPAPVTSSTSAPVRNGA